MNRLLYIALIGIAVLAPRGATAQERDYVLTRTDTLEGTLLSADESGVTIELKSGATARADAGDIRVLRVFTGGKTRFVDGMLYGFIPGFAAGFAVAASVGAGEGSNDRLLAFGLIPLGMGVITGLAGGLVALIIDAFHPYTIYDIEYDAPAYRESLENIREDIAVPNG